MTFKTSAWHGEAVDFLRSADMSLLSVSELCAETGLTPCTLEYASKEPFSVSANGLLHQPTVCCN